MNLQVFYQWFEELSKHLSSMSRWQLKNLHRVIQLGCSLGRK